MRYTALVALMVTALAGGLMAQTQIKKEPAAKPQSSTEAVTSKGGSVAPAQSAATDVKKAHREHETTVKAQAEKETHEALTTTAKAGEEQAKSTHARTWSKHKHNAQAKTSSVKEQSSQKTEEPAK